MKVNKQMLLDKEACLDQVDLFVSLFGEEVKVTKANCLKAWKAGIDFQWAADNLLTKEQRDAYEAIRQPAWKDYLAITRPAWKAYQAIEQPAWKDYLAIEQPAREEYEKQCALAFYAATKGTK